MNRTHLLLMDIGWSRSELARRLGVAYRTVEGWAMGTIETPRNVQAWLEILAKVHRLYPEPEDWKQGDE